DFGRCPGWRPRRLPRALAATIPERIRSWISSRSNSAMPASMVASIRPCGVARSNVIPFKATTDTRRASNSFSVASRSVVLRPHRESWRRYCLQPAGRPGSDHAGSAFAAELHGLRQHADGPARARRADLAETHRRYRAAGADTALLGPCEPIWHVPARHDRTLAPRFAHRRHCFRSVATSRRLTVNTQPLLCIW